MTLVLLIFVFLGFFSTAEELKTPYEVVSEDGQIEVYIEETPPSVPVNQSKNEIISEEEEMDTYSFCDSAMQEPIKRAVMKQLHEPCDEVTLEDLARIQGLSLIRVQLEHIGPDDFLGLDNLTHLDFYDNRLQSIHPDSFKNLKQLNHLGVSHNMISKISKNLLESLKNLNYLDLSHNFLTELSEGFLIHVSRLKYLNLSHNSLRKINDNTFINLVHLKHLDLSYNQLTRVESGALTFLIGLMDLDISHNQLKQLTLSSLDHLIKLNLSYNQLSSLEWFSFEKLIEWDLSHNQLTYIQWDLVERLPDLKTFNYSGNALNMIEINPERDLYDTGVDQEWYDCWLTTCANTYAYISVNQERYKFMQCRGNKPNSRCIQLSQEWQDDLDAGHTLILRLRDKFIQSVDKKTSS